MSQAILAAARRCYLRFGVQKTTMADIASEAALSRATLYRRFETRDQVFLDVLAIESQELAADTAAVLAGIDDPAERVVEGIVYCLTEIPKRPLLHHLLSGDSAHWSAQHALGSKTLQQISRSLLGLSLETDKHVSANETKLDDLAEWAHRIVVSLATLPSPRCPDEVSLRRLLRTILQPAVRDVLREKGGAQ